MEILGDEIPRFKSKIHMLHLCFTTDPFMYEYDEVGDMSLAAIKKFNAAGIPCSVLTKGILPAELANCSKENEYGITLVSVNEEFRSKMEPGSAAFADRLAALRVAHGKKVKDANTETLCNLASLTFDSYEIARKREKTEDNKKKSRMQKLAELLHP